MTFPVALVGGSNGTAYFSALWSSGYFFTAHDVRVVTRRPERFGEPLKVVESQQPAKGTVLGDSVFAPIRFEEFMGGKVAAYNYDEMAEAIKDVAAIFICAPVNAYPELLAKIMPAAAIEAERRQRTKANPLVVACTYSQGGVDFMAISKAGGRLPENVALCLFKNFPGLLSRTGETEVTNWGFHPNCAWFAPVPKRAGPTCKKIVSTLFGHCKHDWAIQELSSPILCTLGGSNQLLHPTIIGGLVGEAPGRTFETNPKVYRNLPFSTFTLMASIWMETMALAETLETKFQLKIMDKVGFAGPVRNFMKINGHKWLPTKVVAFCAWGAINGSSRLRAAKMPLIPNPHKGDEISKKGNDGSLVLNTEHRFIVDDVPFGLCVLYGMAAIVGCPMPETGKLISQLQLYLKKEYVTVKGARFVLEGRDVMETGAPQAYGVHTMSELRALIIDGRLPNVDMENETTSSKSVSVPNPQETNFPVARL